MPKNFLADTLSERMYRSPDGPGAKARKARGVFYTPWHIVRYIIGHTVAKLLDACRSPEDVARLKILDPACGTGCFLLGAYRVLEKWHRFDRIPGKLRASILRNNIFGVDIDSRAVARARSLLCQAAEVDDGAGLLKGNIKCGNSLIATDFEWEREFSNVMNSGGFDCVIGNPPYVFTRSRGFCREEKAYFARNYRHQTYQLNAYALFLERSIGLLRRGGVCGYIVPSNWLTISSMKPFRDFMLNSTGDLRVVNNTYRVFPDASVDTSLVLFTKTRPGRVQLLESPGPDEFQRVASVPAARLKSESVIQIGMYRDRKSRRIIERIESRSGKLSDFCKVSTGLKAYQTGKGCPPQTSVHKAARVFHSSLPKDVSVDTSWGRYLEGKDVRRYRLAWSGSYLRYGDWLAEPRRSVPFDGQRLLVRQIPARPPYLVHAAYTDGRFYNDLNSMVVHTPLEGVSLKYLLGLVNSRLISFWFMKKYDKLQRRIFPQFKVGELRSFPVPPVADRERHDRLVSLVDRMLENDRTVETDREIDALVYELFGIGKKDIQHIVTSVAESAT